MVDLEDPEEESEKGKREVSTSKIAKLRVTFPQVSADEEIIASTSHSLSCHY